MPTPRAAVIHDLSGFGRCSLTEVMPILSVMGVQCCPLPTAFLSTHTGGFEGFTFLDMTEELPRVAAHWKSLDLRFQAIYSGFLGSGRQIGIVSDFIRDFRGPDTLVVVDPVMGDDGRAYQTYTPAMCAGMAELAKLKKIIDREMPDASVETLLVLDATTGQNGLIQAKQFKETTGCTGIVLTKLDGTAKGGIVIAIAQELQVPVKFVGLGEDIKDMQPFDAEEYVNALI